MWASAGADCVQHSEEEGGEAPYAGVFDSEGRGLQFGLYAVVKGFGMGTGCILLRPSYLLSWKAGS